MRFLPLILVLFPGILWAEEIPLTSKVTDVTLYPQGATIVRQVPFSAPAGIHDLILLDLPRNTDIATVRVAVDGATLGSVTARRDFVPPQDDRTTAAIDAAEAEVERLEAALRGAQADIQRVRLETEAADARVAFLSMIGKGEGVAQMDVAALRALVGMIGAETLAAKQTAHDARLRADADERDLKDLMKELDKARQALKALVPEKTDRVGITPVGHVLGKSCARPGRRKQHPFFRLVYIRVRIKRVGQTVGHLNRAQHVCNHFLVENCHGQMPYPEYDPNSKYERVFRQVPRWFAPETGLKTSNPLRVLHRMPSRPINRLTRRVTCVMLAHRAPDATAG